MSSSRKKRARGRYGYDEETGENASRYDSNKNDAERDQERKPPPSKKASVAALQEETKKQKQQKAAKQSPAVSSKAKRRPPPPPPPPPALVKLLQSNKAVLKYFQSLQENLDADVQIWKGRAKQYQQEKEELEAQLKTTQHQKEKQQQLPSKGNKEAPAVAELKTPTNFAISRAIRKHQQSEEPAVENSYEHIGDGDEHVSDTYIRRETGGGLLSKREDKEEAKEEGIEIDDAMLNFDDDSSDSDDDNDDDVDGNSSCRGQDDIQKKNELQVVENTAVDINLETRMHQALFALESSSESNSDDDDDEDDEKSGTEELRDLEDKLLGRENTVPTVVTKGTTPIRPEAALLCEAFRAMESLGVALVEEEVVPLAPVEKDVLPPEQTHSPVEGEPGRNGREEDEKHEESKCTTWIRRSDEDVAADLLWAIHGLTRVQLLEKDLVNMFPPFVTPKLIPTCNFFNYDHQEQPHPIIKGRELLFRFLLIVDTYCAPDMYSEEMWLEMFQTGFAVANDQHDGGGGEKDDKSLALKSAIGLKNRKGLVESLVNSLDGEITQFWPMQDRSTNFHTPAFHILEMVYDAVDASEKCSRKNADCGDEAEKKATPLFSLVGDAAETDVTNHTATMDSKIQGRLSSLVERAVLVQMIISFHLSRNDPDRAAHLIWRYFISTIPGANEDLPKLPPVLSLVVLESMLLPQRNMMMNWPPEEEFTSQQDNQPLTLWKLLFYGEDEGSEVMLTAEKVLHLCITVVGSIWQMREIKATSARIRDLAKVEVAAYQRLCQIGIATMCEESLFSHDWKNQVGVAAELLCRTLENLEWNDGSCCLAALAYQLCLILGGRDPTKFLQEGFDAPSKIVRSRFLAKCQAIREIEIRHLECSRSAIGSEVAKLTPFQYWLSDPFINSDNSSDAAPNLEFHTSVLRGASILSNGSTVYRCMETTLESPQFLSSISSNEERSLVLASLLELSSLPLVRVINLRCRPDRMKSFYIQAMGIGLRVVHAVASLGDDMVAAAEDPKINSFYGLHAFDGRGRWLDASERLSKEVGGHHLLGRFVETHWRPNELKAFDSNAPDGEGLVRSSPSEQACALSHIASWKGCLRSFQFIKKLQEETKPPPGSVLRPSEKLKRLFHLSGFAQGPALLSANKEMNPAPVCVILEDDAILVDRFVDRLQDLLKELPRDFHFCSLGYSRPKTAPIVSYRKHIGIPTNLYYLSGYLISEAGAKYLLDSLPVVGPVDSWVGLKMTSNFDNSFGTAVGVGRNSKPLAEPLYKKDLCTILQFRAFCALQPLCSQRVGNILGGPSTGRAWRQRDTDIEFSGNLSYSAVRSKRT